MRVEKESRPLANIFSSHRLSSEIALEERPPDASKTRVGRETIIRWKRNY
jgi:hypothetical protein